MGSILPKNMQDKNKKACDSGPRIMLCNSACATELSRIITKQRKSIMASVRVNCLSYSIEGFNDDFLHGWNYIFIDSNAAIWLL